MSTATTAPITLTQEQLSQMIAAQVAQATAALTQQLNAAKTGGKGACTGMAVIPAGKSEIDGKNYSKSALRIERVGLMAIMVQTPVVQYLVEHADELKKALEVMTAADAKFAAK